MVKRNNTISTINEKFTKEEYDKLLVAKNGKSWHDFILEKCLPKKTNPYFSDLDLMGNEGVL